VLPRVLGPQFSERLDQDLATFRDRALIADCQCDHFKLEAFSLFCKVEDEGDAGTDAREASPIAY